MSTKTERLTRAVRWLQAYATLMTVALDDQDGRVGIYVGDGNDRIFLGNAAAGHGLSSLPDPFQGLRLTRNGETVHELNVAKNE